MRPHCHLDRRPPAPCCHLDRWPPAPCCHLDRWPAQRAGVERSGCERAVSGVCVKVRQPGKEPSRLRGRFPYQATSDSRPDVSTPLRFARHDKRRGASLDTTERARNFPNPYNRITVCGVSLPMSFPRKRESTTAAAFLDPRLRGGDRGGIDPPCILIDALRYSSPVPLRAHCKRVALRCAACRSRETFARASTRRRSASAERP
jgi:hypothetical protein